MKLLVVTCFVLDIKVAHANLQRVMSTVASSVQLEHCS